MTTTVTPETTRVTGRRVVQYLVDLLLVGAVLSALSLLINALAPEARLEQLGAGWRTVERLTAVGGLPTPATTLLTLAVWLVVFVAVPIRWGRTPGMALLGLTVVRVDGGRPAPGQHVLRAAVLMVDGAGGGVLGWIVIVCSRRRQRMGDHAAGTLVVAAPSATAPRAPA